MNLSRINHYFFLRISLSIIFIIQLIPIPNQDWQITHSHFFSFSSCLFAATFTVTNNNPAGAGSLADAVSQANGSGDASDLIKFDPSVTQITLNSPLSLTNGNLTISGTQGAGNNPKVEIIGQNGVDFGFIIQSDNNTLQSLSIIGFNTSSTSSAILIDGGNQNKILGCHIGVHTDGITGSGNSVGIYLANNSNSNQIGNLITKIADRNIIASNTHSGIFMTSGTNNLVHGNFIGVNQNGNALGNLDGINIQSNSNTIGITGTSLNNIISGNSGTGIKLNGQNNIIENNHIGLSVNGSNKIANGSNGITILAPGNTIKNNRISGNTGHGISFSATGTALTLIQGNLIGTDISSELPISNGTNGVRFQGVGASNIIFKDNIVSGNTATGVEFDNTSSALFESNIFGANKNRTNAVPNGAGVSIENGSFNVTFTGNSVLGNTGHGLFIDNSSQINVIHNYFGYTPVTKSGLSNASFGIHIFNGSSNNLVTRNVIAFNGSDGISIQDSTSLNNRITQNTFFSNASLAIDLNNDDRTENDAGDTDTGPNQLLNHPIITNIDISTNPKTVSGTLDIDSNETGATIEVYAADPLVSNDDLRPEGRYYIGSTTPINNSDGSWTLSTTNTYLSSNWIITALAIDSNGNTSEFSPVIATSQTGEESQNLEFLHGAYLDRSVDACDLHINNNSSSSLTYTGTIYASDNSINLTFSGQLSGFQQQIIDLKSSSYDSVFQVTNSAHVKLSYIGNPNDLSAFISLSNNNVELLTTKNKISKIIPLIGYKHLSGQKLYTTFFKSKKHKTSSTIYFSNTSTSSIQLSLSTYDKNSNVIDQIQKTLNSLSQSSYTIPPDQSYGFVILEIVSGSPGDVVAVLFIEDPKFGNREQMLIDPTLNTSSITKDDIGTNLGLQESPIFMKSSVAKKLSKGWIIISNISDQTLEYRTRLKTKKKQFDLNKKSLLPLHSQKIKLHTRTHQLLREISILHTEGGGSMIASAYISTGNPRIGTIYPLMDPFVSDASDHSTDIKIPFTLTNNGLQYLENSDLSRDLPPRNRLLIQNIFKSDINTNISFYNSNGSLLNTLNQTMSANQTSIFHIHKIIPNSDGLIVISHDGDQGSLLVHGFTRNWTVGKLFQFYSAGRRDSQQP